MAIKLEKGQGINLTKQLPTLKSVRVGLGWEQLNDKEDIDLDATLFACHIVKGEPKLITDQHFVFYNNKLQ